MEKISTKFISNNRWDRYEGNTGLKNLARIVSHLGYQDHAKYGLFEPGVAYGNIFSFLEDNPGAIERIVEFILEFYGEVHSSDTEDDCEDECE